MEALLEAKGIKKEYRLKDNSSLHAVSDVSFSLEKGGSLAVVGESGCGKSTLAKLLTRMESISGGDLYFEGKNITHLKGQELRRQRREIQMVFQQPSAAISPRMRIEEFLRVPLVNFGIVPPDQVSGEIDRLLEMVHLDRSYRSKYPHEVSGGELQRIVIARAMAPLPKLIICDEATSALDVSIQSEVLDLIRSLREEHGIAILFITHDLAIVKEVSERVMIMYRGRVVELLPSALLVRESVHPYTRFLLGSVFSIYDSQDRQMEVLPDMEYGNSAAAGTEGCVFASRCPHCSERCRTVRPELQPLHGNAEHLTACHLFQEKSQHAE